VIHREGGGKVLGGSERVGMNGNGGVEGRHGLLSVLGVEKAK